MDERLKEHDAASEKLARDTDETDAENEKARKTLRRAGLLPA